MPTLTGCWLPGPAPDSAVTAIEAPKGKFPFKTKEPENFQCDIIETAGQITRRKRLAMKGPWARLDLDLGTADHRAVLVTDKEYLIDLGRKLYAENAAPPAGPAGRFSELTRELLLASPRTNFKEVGREGAVITYRASTDSTDKSEVLIHYDTALELPVKQEFFSIGDGRRTLSFSIEIVNFSLEPDPALFELPAGFRRASFDEVSGRPRL